MHSSVGMCRNCKKNPVVNNGLCNELECKLSKYLIPLPEPVRPKKKAPPASARNVKRPRISTSSSAINRVAPSMYVVFICSRCRRKTSPSKECCNGSSYLLETHALPTFEGEVLADVLGTKRCLCCETRYSDTEPFPFCIRHRDPAMRAAVILHCPGIESRGCPNQQRVDVFNKLCEACGQQKFLNQYPACRIGSASGAGNNCLIDSLLQVVNPLFRAQSTEQRKEVCNAIRTQLVGSKLAEDGEYLGTDDQVQAILHPITFNTKIYKITTFYIGVNNKLMQWVNHQGEDYGKPVVEDLYLWNHESILVDASGQIVSIKHFSPIFF